MNHLTIWIACFRKLQIHLCLLLLGIFGLLTSFWMMCPSAFIKGFLSNFGFHTESRTEHFIWITGVDSSNSVNHDQVQVLSFSKYSLLFLPVVGIEPATSRWFHLEALSNQALYPLCHMSLPEFDMKHLMKAEGHICWNVMSITIKKRSVVRIF